MMYIIKLVPLQVSLMPFGKQAMLPFMKYGKQSFGWIFPCKSELDSTQAKISLRSSGYGNTYVSMVFIEKYGIS